MRLARVLVGISAALSFAAASPAQSGKATRAMSYTKFTLPNGLVTIVNEDHSTPIVGIDVMYHVGSKDEPPGHQEEAHTCEHWVFEGSPHQARDGKAFYGALGGGANGYTVDDKTDLIATVPSNALETALWYEADRMAAPAFHSDSQTFAIVRATVANERRQHLAPAFGADHDALLRGLFPKDYPYSWTAGDALPSVATTPVAEVHAFCVAHYVPSNAVLAISGDANPAQVRTWVEKYFGPIPRGSSPKTILPKPTLTAANRIVLEDAHARFSGIRLGWIGAGYSSADKMAMQALGFVLTGDRRSGLQKALIYDRKLATFVNASNYDEELYGEFVITINATPTGSLTAIEQVVDSAVAAVRDHPPSAGLLADFRGFTRLSAIYGLETRTMRADTLAQGEGWVHDPVRYVKDLEQADAVTPQDVQRVAREYLTAGRVVLSLVPAGKLDLISQPNLPYTRMDGDGFPVKSSPSGHHEHKTR